MANVSEQKAHHEAFTSWLGSHLKNDDSEAHQKLNSLSSDNSELEDVIRKASEVVTNHVDDFKLPVSKDGEVPDSDQVYHVLLTQWKQFQHADGGMSKAVLFESAKPQTILPNDGKFADAITSEYRSSTKKLKAIESGNSVDVLNSSYLLSPLQSGIAINAP